MSTAADGLKPKFGSGTVIAVRKHGQGASAAVYATSSDEPTCDKPLKASFSRSTAPRALLEILCVAAVVLLALLCLSWSLWLMLLTASPDATVNRLMDTSSLDFGAFWRFGEAPKAVADVGLAGLGCVALGYVIVLWQIASDVLGCRKPRRYNAPAGPGSRYTAKVSGLLAAIRTGHDDAPHGSRRWSASRLASDVMDRESKTRRVMHSVVKIADVAIQCVWLAQLMETGMPVSLIGVFAATVVLNALGAAVMFVVPSDNMGRAQLLVDTAFDFVVAMAFPMLVATYALSSFTFDQTLMAINTQVFPPGFFELVAGVVADPIEIEIVRSALDSLRIDSVVKVFTRVGTSAALCRRFFGLAELLRTRGSTGFPNIYPSQHRPLTALFLAVAVAVVVVTTGSVTTSSAACAMHPECVQIARRWISNRAANDATRCPCLAMIDSNVAISTFDEWNQPFDRTEKLAQLASSGDLQTLQLVNRALPTFPEQLRRCKNLKHVALFYTETVVMPDWFAEFTKLEFFHVEGKSLFQSLQHLPEGLFDHMDELAFVHMGLQGLRRLPSLDGLTNLKTLILGGLFLLTELPSFDKLHRLERITVAATPGVDVFPDLTNVRDLQSLVVADRGAFCCNGFLGADRCNLTRSLCQQHLSGAPAITQCLTPDRMASPATRAYFDRFPFSACFGESARAGEFKLPPTREEMAPCNGTLFRACEAPGTPRGTPAMCYNSRWMAVSCDPSPFPMAMRRRQITLGRGAPCDPAIEAWLGCKAL